MPGVNAILTAEEVPGPKDQVNDAGVMIRANPRNEEALTSEPLYQGEPVLAVAAIDELTAAEAMEKVKVRWEPLPFSVDPVASLLPGTPNPRSSDARIPPAFTGVRRNTSSPIAAEIALSTAEHPHATAKRGGQCCSRSPRTCRSGWSGGSKEHDPSCLLTCLYVAFLY